MHVKLVSYLNNMKSNVFSPLFVTKKLQIYLKKHIIFLQLQKTVFVLKLFEFYEKN